MTKFLAWLCATFGIGCITPPPVPVPPPPPPVQNYSVTEYFQGKFDRYDSNEKTYLASHYSWVTFAPDLYLNDYLTFSAKTSQPVALYMKTLGVKPTDSWYAEAQAKNLFWRDANGQIITNPSNGWQTLDVVNRTNDVATYWINYVSSFLSKSSYTALFMDNSNLPDNYMPTNSMPGYSPQAYLAAIGQIADALRAKFPQLKILANGSVFNQGTNSAIDGSTLMPHVDGLMSELYSLKSGTTLKSYGADRLVYRLKAIRELTKQGKFIVLLDDTSTDEKTNFSFCMYLASRDDKGKVLWSKGTPNEPLHFAQDDLDLGLPTAEPVINPNLVTRTFQKGKVVINISDAPVTVSQNQFGQSQYVFSGNGPNKTAQPVTALKPVTGDVIVSPLSCVITN